MKSPHARALDILISNDGTELRVILKSGRACRVHNVAWGYDLGENIAHITTNISPPQNENEYGETCEEVFFSADEIAQIIDPYDNAMLYDSTTQGQHQRGEI